ncbi:transcription termination factor Rho [Amycolatopsis antarctica]|uniref:Transcription termination factor Rho n=1 Tax=Amycolatopsis antarctica TaxID=1854586 RepID=A0A263D5N5_9PSEU|nr:transcription termination factor Rho [Amycolatopsis antarctica]OZM73822.1 transcription termination factor Rho [Amycolatopsis antarctica]
MSNTDLLSGDADTQPAPAAEGGADDSGAGEQANGAGAPKRRAGGLSGMVIADLRQLAGELGVSDTSGMRKGDLIAAIRERQGKTKRRAAGAGDTLPLDGVATETPAEAPKSEAPKNEPSKNEASKNGSGRTGAETRSETTAAASGAAPATEAPNETSSDAQSQPERTDGRSDAQQGEDGGRREGGRRRRGANRPAGSPDSGGQREDGEQQRGGDRDQQRGDQQRGDRQRGGEQRGGDQRKQNDRQDRQDRQQGGQRGQQGQQNNRGGGQPEDDDDERGGRRGRRFRDRRRRGGRGEGGGAGNPDTEIREDDVLLPVAGILDVLDNYAFVRTSGYLAGPNDVYVSLSLVRKYGLRRGDAITGHVRQPRDGEQQRQKFNPLVKVDTINGLDPDAAKKRPEFTKLTPLYPNERLRLETEPHKLTTRVIDLVMPVGKGQRALIVSPPKAGKTTILQDIANAIATNNPECHLMVVLVDERPEEVTDMERSVNGEVIAATFDRPASDHTTLAELAIERAKRLVEMGHDVVVLLDSVTRLGRSYNLAAPASGRILSGGVDSTALYPPKRFLGAARNIENGGSLTIFATALVETGSTGDSVIFEEFKGTGNAELKLDRKIADKRTFPAVDVNPSSTRKEELLLNPDELAVTHKLHRVLHALDSQQAIELLLDRLRKTKTNIEFLMQVSKNTPGQDD